MNFQQILERLTKATERKNGLPLCRETVVKTADLRELIYHFNRIDKELREQEQNFKQKEFDYRTKCQNIVSAARLEADKIAKGGFVDAKKFTEDTLRVTQELENQNTFYKLMCYESDGRE
jgi:hypothetical protein